MAQRAVFEASGVEQCEMMELVPTLGIEAAEPLARAFNALADPVRLRLLNLLAIAPEGEVCICNLTGPVRRSQPTVSHHMKILGEAGLVSGDRRGKWVYYSLNRDRLGFTQAAVRAVAIGATTLAFTP